jgi:hypothetical protein
VFFRKKNAQGFEIPEESGAAPASRGRDRQRSRGAAKGLRNWGFRILSP